MPDNCVSQYRLIPNIFNDCLLDIIFKFYLLHFNLILLVNYFLKNLQVYGTTFSNLKKIFMV
jgi:hypothetical protein